MNESTSKNKRSFKISPEIIHHLIQNQAGTLSKALLEYVMNSTDALATKVDIQLDRDFVIISDDGIGFRNRDEVESFFEVLGFRHDENDHQLYGITEKGRAEDKFQAITFRRFGSQS